MPSHDNKIIYIFRAPNGIRVMVSDDGHDWTEAPHTGNIPGTITLNTPRELKYFKLVMIEDFSSDEVSSKPLGIRSVQLYGCPLGKVYENCTDKAPTRLSTDVKGYRHIG